MVALESRSKEFFLVREEKKKLEVIYLRTKIFKIQRKK